MMRRPEELSSDFRNFFIISSRGEIDVEGDSWERLVLVDAETGESDIGTVGDRDNGKVASS